MSAYKQFLAQDIEIIPFTVNKGYNLQSLAQVTGSNIDLYLGENTTNSVFIPSLEPTTGLITSKYKKLVYNSIKELYYSNHLSSSYGDKAHTASLYPGVDEEGNVSVGAKNSTNYWEYPQTTLFYTKYFPTGSSEKIGVISVPSKVYGDYIQPKSFKLHYQSSGLDYSLALTATNPGTLTSASAPNTSGSYSLWPFIGANIHGFGIVSPSNAYFNTSSMCYVFNTIPSVPVDFGIFIGTSSPVTLSVSSSYRGIITSSYQNESVTFTVENIQLNEQFYLLYQSNNTVTLDVTPPNNYVNFALLASDVDPVVLTDDGEGNLYSNLGDFAGNIFYPHGIAVITSNNYVINNLSSSLLTCSFSSSYTIYESQYKCSIKENEFNFSLNPSLIKNNMTGSLYEFATGSYFSPYITTVGLYNDQKELLAIGKFAQPVQVSPTTDTHILINIDRV